MSIVQSITMRATTACAVALFSCSLAFAQTQQVKGTVLDNLGDPLAGVNIVEKGTTNGTLTDIDGNFALNVARGKTLVFSFIGYRTTEVVVSGTTLNVTLEEDSELLEDVVVIGYGSMQRKDLTSSITTVKAKDLNTGVFADAGSMLQGKVPGLVVTTTGDPNGGSSMTLRGASSLRGGAAMSPYYVIDGIPGVDISMVAPDDIESIDVLRDATATAIYGSKAANGVIIVTTKSGNKDEKTNVTYNGYVAFDNVLMTLDMASAADIRDYVIKNNLDYAYDEGADVDWQNEVLRTGVSHNHNVSINGGNKKTTYMASINFRNREGVVEGTEMNRLNVRSLISTKILKEKLQLSVGVNAMYAKHKNVPMENEGRSVLDAMNFANPTAPIRFNSKDAENGHVGEWHFAAGNDAYNPVSMINEDPRETIYKRMQFIGKATLNIVEGLTWSANFQYNNNQSIYNSYSSHATQLKIGEGVTAIAGNTLNGAAHRNTYFGDEMTFETYGNWDKTFNDIHKVAVMAGYSWEEHHNNDGFGLTVHTFHDDNLLWNQLTYAGEIDGMSAVESGTKENIRNISFYGRVSYSFNSRYMLQATIRRDGSSVFGDGKQWGTFPSASIAWNITEEEWMKNQNIFNTLKLRLGYGISGNAMGFDSYAAVATYGRTSGYNSFNGHDYVILGATKLANPDLKWESTSMFNVGVDYGFINGRINGSLEFYNKNTKDLIWNYPVSKYIYPFDNIWANVGEINNVGVEFSINATPVLTKNFTWNTTLNLSHNKNEVKSLSNDRFHTDKFYQGNPMVAGVSANGDTQRIIEGEPLGTFWTYEWAGYDDGGASVYYVLDDNGNRTGEKTASPDPDHDRKITGCAQPKLNLGWNNNFMYKNWSASFFLTGVFGQDVYNGLRAHYTAPDFFSGGKNVLKEFITDRPATDTRSNVPSDRFIEDGSYIRLQNLTVGYTFNGFDNWFQSLNLYVTVNNVFTITDYKGLDPEVNLGGIDPGVDYRWSTYPHTRTTMIGVKINF
ncbi:MAG: TonB-dependent receptor [Bacteroidales bacterium]|nr:TonB-dependent receptor [Bacteroidales bacterium]